MDAVYSEAFDHLKQYKESGDGYTDINEVDSVHQRGSHIARTSAVKKRSGQFIPPPRLDIHDDMGQSSSSEYIDVFNVNPRINQPPHRRQIRSEDFDHGHVHHSGRGLAEYSYATSVDTEGIVERRSAPVQQPSINLTDDYSQPQDRVSISSKGDYTEPYESQLNNGKGDPVQTGNVYELAKDVDLLRKDHKAVTTQESTESNQYDTTASSQSSEMNNQGEAYDHINNWKSKGMRLDTNLNQAAEVGALKSAEKAFPSSSNYEEPWDSMRGQEKLSMLMEKAEITDNRRQSVEQNVTSKETGLQSQPSQEGFKGRRRPKPLKTTPSTSSQVYEVAWEGPKVSNKDGATTDKQKSPSATTGQQKSPGAPASKVTRQPRCDYEDAWDSPGMQQQFEEKLEMARRQRASLDQGRLSSEQGASRVSQEHIVSDLPRSPQQKTPSPLASPVRFKSRGDSGPIDFIPPMRKPSSNHENIFARSDSIMSLGALAEKVDLSLPLKKQPFFHGKLKRSEAERLLLVYKEGSYLIRQSESCKKDFSLTLKGWNSLPMHMKICCQTDGTYILGENSPPFYTIPEMVYYYTNHELPVQDAERICLLYQIPS